MKKQSILVVDDEKNIRLTMHHSLELLKIPIKEAMNGEEALGKLQQEPFGVVFLDLKMPGMDGMEVLRRIKASWPLTRVIIITAHGTVDTAVEAMKQGAIDFIQKPFTPDEIREIAHRVMEREMINEEKAVDYADLIEVTKRQISDREFSMARETARKAIAADPTHPEAYNLLGALYEIENDPFFALKFYRAALDIDPAYRPAASNLERMTSLHKFGGLDLGSGKHDDHR